MKGSLCRLAETSFLWRDTAMRIRERFNPRAPCGARHAVIAVLSVLGEISTHAPLAGRDDAVCLIHPVIFPISTHAPLAGRDERVNVETMTGQRFQPTRPLRGATVWGIAQVVDRAAFQPTRPLRGATTNIHLRRPCLRISTHAPLAGRDQKMQFIQRVVLLFQPTRPLRGATIHARYSFRFR